jgi:hypothetical protein
MMIINNENIINDGGGGSEEHEHINTVLCAVCTHKKMEMMD